MERECEYKQGMCAGLCITHTTFTQQFTSRLKPSVRSHFLNLTMWFLVSLCVRMTRVGASVRDLKGNLWIREGHITKRWSVTSWDENTLVTRTLCSRHKKRQQLDPLKTNWTGNLSTCWDVRSPQWMQPLKWHHSYGWCSFELWPWGGMTGINTIITFVVDSLYV